MGLSAPQGCACEHVCQRLERNSGNAFFFHEGYWGPHVGYYGGINYGFGYGGRGYEGGRWENNHFYYNTSVNHINNENIHNTYNTRVEYNSGNRVSYNGGKGGMRSRGMLGCGSAQPLFVFQNFDLQFRHFLSFAPGSSGCSQFDPFP
jgi:hypothetical protein